MFRYALHGPAASLIECVRMNKVIFNKISVVQSLSDSELHTGTKVKDDIELYNFAYARGLEIELLDAKDKNEFIRGKWGQVYY